MRTSLPAQGKGSPFCRRGQLSNLQALGWRVLKDAGETPSGRVS